MIHPLTEVRFISPEVGYGVVAKEFIPKGTITWVLDEFDREFTPEEAAKLSPLHQEILDVYAYRNNKGKLVLCWDNARFVNHSFRSNCLSTAYEFEIAIRDIQAGEQLTDDYGYLNVDHPFTAIDEGTRRKRVYPDDLLRYHKEWDKKLLKALQEVPKVNQPLEGLLPEATRKRIDAILQGETQMESILSNYFPGMNGQHSVEKSHVNGKIPLAN